jgi:hypothetical protein
VKSQREGALRRLMDELETCLEQLRAQKVTTGSSRALEMSSRTGQDEFRYEALHDLRARH